MDPASLLLTLLMKNPDFAASAAQNAMAPGTVDVAKMQGSLADLSKGILNCYHKTAKFRQTDIVKTPWERQAQYGAQKSAVLRITFTGLTSAQHQMLVAVMIKGSSVRSAVIVENSLVPYNKNCSLEDWVSPT
jgi:hypothetical protein